MHTEEKLKLRVFRILEERSEITYILVTPGD